MVTEHLSRSEDPLSKPRALFRGLAKRLERAYSVTLPVPTKLEDWGLQDLKEFSTGLLETSAHPWATAISGLGPDSRLTIAGSLFLWRKVLPASPVSADDFIRRVTAKDPELPDGYLRHVRKIAEEQFRKGWDKDCYLASVEGYTPTIKSVKENGRAKGGYRSLAPDRYEFGLKCTDFQYEGEIDNSVKFLIAPCDGKDRAVTIMSTSAQVLGPLHDALYKHISTKKWLLRGKAKPTCFKEFNRKEGEVFVSGDYEAATDHLPLSTAKIFLEVAFRNSVHIPPFIKKAAFDLLYATVVVEGEEHKTTRQLMGSLLCFPLLCLQNYTAFRFIYDESVPVRVNGDDIVFRSTREDYQRWSQFVGKVGLKLSVGKTMVHNYHFSLNSTFFKSRWYRQPKLIPVVRCTTLMKSSDANSLASSHHTFLEGFSKGSLARTMFSAWFLEKKKRVIQKSGRSVVRGLKIRATDASLKEARLWQRELYYLNSVPNQSEKIGEQSECKLPEPPSSKFRWTTCPRGWKRRELKNSTKELLEEEKEFFDILVENTWADVPLVVREREAEQAYWDELQLGGFEPAWNRFRKNKYFFKKGVNLEKKLEKCQLLRSLLPDYKKRSRLRSKPFYDLPVPKRVKLFWAKTKDDSVELFEAGGARLEEGMFARMPYDCDDGTCRPINFFPPPVEDSFVIYQGWMGLAYNAL